MDILTHEQPVFFGFWAKGFAKLSPRFKASSSRPIGGDMAGTRA